MKRKLLALTLAVTIVVGLLALCACNGKDKKTSPERGFVHADGIRVIDGFGNPVGLQGTNLGGWLVQEEWLCPTEDGNSSSGSFDHLTLIKTLYDRFGKTEGDKLINAYETNWITEADFANVKSLGLNTVRIPFAYFNLMEAFEYSEESGEYEKIPYAELALKENAFARLDWAVSMCEKYSLYAILDLHGAVGSQSGNDHTGDISVPSGGRLWQDNAEGQICRDKTKELWVAIASRYKDNKWVAAYDLMNEPGIKNADGAQTTNETVWDYFDELYDAIREVDANHLISVESCWESYNLPSLTKYGWENVLYQFHHYNWASANMANNTFYHLKVLTLEGLTARNYPVLIGEFNVWPDTHPDKDEDIGNRTQTEEEAWRGVMELYAGKGWSYTTWTLKHAATNSSWGLYNLNEDSVTAVQANFLTMTYDEIMSAWSAHSAANYHENEWLTGVIKGVIDSFYVGETLKPIDEEYSILAV